jgi:hypothetical protein
MNYLEAFLKERTRAEKPHTLTDKADKTPSVSFGSESPAPPSTSFCTPRSARDRQRWSDHARPPVPLRRCGSLVCVTCHAYGPSPHREDCASPRFDPCCSPWFWLSSHGAIKCVACAAPADLGLVEAWVLARETGEGDDGWQIPSEILSLLRITSPPQ